MESEVHRDETLRSGSPITKDVETPNLFTHNSKDKAKDEHTSSKSDGDAKNVKKQRSNCQQTAEVDFRNDSHLKNPVLVLSGKW